MKKAGVALLDGTVEFLVCKVVAHHRYHKKKCSAEVLLVLVVCLHLSF